MTISNTTNNAALSVPVLIEAIEGALTKRSLLLGTGAWTFMPNLPMLQGNGLPMAAGASIQIPYFDHVGELDDVSEGGALVPRAVTSSSENATVSRSGIAIEASIFSMIVSQAADPYTEGGRQIGDAAVRRFDKAAIDAALAVGSTDATMVNSHAAGGGADYPILLFRRGAGITWHSSMFVDEDKDILAHTQLKALNVYHATHLWKRPRGGQSTRPGVAKLVCPITGANAFTENFVIETIGKFGDEIDANNPVVMLAMHSAVATYARQLAYSTGEKVYKFGAMGPGPNGGLVKLQPDTFAGIPVFVSDKLTAS